MTTLIIMILVALVLYLALKCFSVTCAARGLMYHFGMKYDDVPSAEELKEITENAVRRTIQEQFKK